MFCANKFNVNISNICSIVVNVRRAVDQYAERKVEEHQMQAADFLRELMNVRDDHLVFSNNVDFNREELHALINYLHKLYRLHVLAILRDCYVNHFIYLFCSCVLRARFHNNLITIYWSQIPNSHRAPRSDYSDKFN